MKTMKMFVVLNRQGNVIGTFRPNPTQLPGMPTLRPVDSPERGHKVHELDVPEHIGTIASAETLHRELKSFLTQNSGVTGPAPHP